jgi:hypothetical protein
MTRLALFTRYFTASKSHPSKRDRQSIAERGHFTKIKRHLTERNPIFWSGRPVISNASKFCPTFNSSLGVRGEWCPRVAPRVDARGIKRITRTKRDKSRISSRSTVRACASKFSKQTCACGAESLVELCTNRGAIVLAVAPMELLLLASHSVIFSSLNEPPIGSLH